MRMVVTSIALVSAAMMAAPAANACDLEGFGFTRINPFGQHAAWNVPSDPPKPQQSENSRILGAPVPSSAEQSDARDTARRAQDEQQAANATTKAFTVSSLTPADQAKRFTATKD